MWIFFSIYYWRLRPSPYTFASHNKCIYASFLHWFCFGMFAKKFSLILNRTKQEWSVPVWMCRSWTLLNMQRSSLWISKPCPCPNVAVVTPHKTRLRNLDSENVMYIKQCDMLQLRIVLSHAILWKGQHAMFLLHTLPDHVWWTNNFMCCMEPEHCKKTVGMSV